MMCSTGSSRVFSKEKWQMAIMIAYIVGCLLFSLTYYALGLTMLSFVVYEVMSWF